MIKCLVVVSLWWFSCAFAGQSTVFVVSPDDVSGSGTVLVNEEVAKATQDSLSQGRFPSSKQTLAW